MKKRILLFHLFICMIAINSNAASKSNEKEYIQTQQEYKSSQLAGPITLTVTATNVKCFGANDGFASASASGGTAPYTFLWSDPTAQNTPTVIGLIAGSYFVIVTDSNGISTSATVTISEPTPLVVGVTSTLAACFGANDGTATVSASGGTVPYTFQWNDPTSQTTPTAIGLNAGVYQIRVTDANGCTSTAASIISEPTKFMADVVATPVTCFGANDGTITINNPRGGIPPYQYSLNGLVWQSTNTFTGLVAGVYELYASDANNCLNTISIITIPEPEPLQAVISVTAETFAGAKDGAITISSQKGGSGAYEYSIDGISWTSSSQFIGLASGTYNIWVRDRNAPACLISIQKVIQPTVTLVADVTHANISCYGGNNGSILISNASGAAIIEYSIDGGVTWTITNAFNGLSAGTYDVMIRDANNTLNKVSLGSVIVTEPTKLQAIFSNYTPPLCAGISGSFSISASGGTPPYTGIGDFVMPSGASRSFIVSDKNGCISKVDFTMPDPPKITATAVVNPPNYCNENGTIVIAATGGTGTLTGVGTFSVQAGKAYNFRVTDSNGCSSNIINGVMPNSGSSASITITGTITEIDFQKQQLGAIDLQVTGGTESYTYQWSNGAITRDIHDLQNGGAYTVTVTDSNGCTLSKSFTLATPNYLPIAKAGADQIVYEGVTVTLDGSGSSDANQDNLTYIWTAPKGILLSNSTSSKPSFLAPEVKRDSIITISLVVNDGKANSSPATVKVAIQNVIKVGNAAPLELSSIKIYPNPTTGILRIERLPENQRNKIVLFSLDGKLIRKRMSSSIVEVIDISAKPSGIYILHINNQRFKIVKE